MMRFIKFFVIFLPFLTVFASCMNPEEYEEKKQGDVLENDFLINDSKNKKTDDFKTNSGDAIDFYDKSDTFFSEKFEKESLDELQPDLQNDEVEEEMVTPDMCSVLFKVKKTAPVAEEFVYLTGDFLADENGNWPISPEEGAIPLEESGDIFKAEVTLENGAYIQYKYLIKWPDTDFKWCTFDGAKVNEESQGFSCNGDEEPMELFVSCD